MNNQSNNPKTQIMPQQTMIMPNGNKTVIMPEDEQNQENYSASYIHIGTVLKNRYTLTKVIAENTGEAALFICEASEGTYVAKIYHHNKKPKQDVLERARQIDSPYIIKVLDDGEIANRYFEILPYYQQGDLLKAAPLDTDTIINIVVPAVNEGLHTLHENGIIHRDIKPNNLFFSNNRKSVIIGDFGISSIIEERMTVRRTSTSRTLGYSAPETAHGFISKESDYYSFGITLLHLATGVDPFLHMTEEQIIKVTLTDKLNIPETIDQRIAHLIKGLTVKERKDRWGYEEIKKWCNGEYVPVNETTPIVTMNPYHFKGKAYYSLNELAIALGQHWEEGIKHLKRGFISEYAKQIRQDLASDIMDCEEERDHDIALFKTIYLLHSEAPLCWKGEVFQELTDLGKEMKQHLPDINNNYLELLRKGMLLHFLQQRKASTDLIKEIEKLQSLSESNSSEAYYKLYFLLNPDGQFEFENASFSNVDELVEFLYEHRLNIEDISARLLKQPFFFAWLEHLGFAEHINEWRKIQYE